MRDLGITANIARSVTSTTGVSTRAEHLAGCIEHDGADGNLTLCCSTPRLLKRKPHRSHMLSINRKTHATSLRLHVKQRARLAIALDSSRALRLTRHMITDNAYALTTFEVNGNAAMPMASNVVECCRMCCS